MAKDIRVPVLPDRYADATVVGAGGAAVVFRVWDTTLARVVAVKVFVAGHGSRSAVDVRDHELDVAAALADHPNVVAALGSGETAEGLPFLVLPYAGGGSLHDRVVEQGPLRRREILSVGVKLAGALASAHAAGFVHGDIKPSNIMFTESLDPWLVDLGAAGPDGRPGERGATAAFVAPELLYGEASSPPSDVFALGRALTIGLLGFGPVAADPETADPDVAQPAVAAVPIAAGTTRSVRNDDPLLELLRRCQDSDPVDRPTPLEVARSLRRLQRRADLDPTEIPLVGRLQPLEEGRDFVEERRPTGRGAAVLALFVVSLVAALTLGALGWRLVNERSASRVDPDTQILAPQPEQVVLDSATIADRCAALELQREQVAGVEAGFQGLIERRSRGEFVSELEIEAVMNPVYDYMASAAEIMVDPESRDAMLSSIRNVRVIAQEVIAGNESVSSLPEAFYLLGDAASVVDASNHCDLSFASVWAAEMGWLVALTGS